jgi:hypothetical protein
MVVFEIRCEKCHYACNSMYFQYNFINWTSGNDDIDKFIQDTQLTAHKYVEKALEWIPYNKFYNIKYIEKIGVHEANWIDGKMCEWDNSNQHWIRYNKNMVVTLKNLINPKNVTLEFVKEVV